MAIILAIVHLSRCQREQRWNNSSDQEFPVRMSLHFFLCALTETDPEIFAPFVFGTRIFVLLHAEQY